MKKLFFITLILLILSIESFSQLDEQFNDCIINTILHNNNKRIGFKSFDGSGYSKYNSCWISDSVVKIEEIFGESSYIHYFRNFNNQLISCDLNGKLSNMKTRVISDSINHNISFTQIHFFINDNDTLKKWYNETIKDSLGNTIKTIGIIYSLSMINDTIINDTIICNYSYPKKSQSDCECYSSFKRDFYFTTIIVDTIYNSKNRFERIITSLIDHVDKETFVEELIYKYNYRNKVRKIIMTSSDIDRKQVLKINYHKK